VLCACLAVTVTTPAAMSSIRSAGTFKRVSVLILIMSSSSGRAMRDAASDNG
jgi:hypothetical protein